MSVSKGPISISFSVSDNYSQHLAVVIASILCNNPESRFVFHVLHRNINEANQKRLKMLDGMYPNCEVLFHPVDASRFDSFPIPPALEHVTRETYFRYILPEVLADEDRTIYSDVDVLCVGDLRPLWETDLKGNIVAAVSEGEAGEAKKKLIGLSGEAPYFNAGILLLDLKAMREGGYTEVLAKNTIKYADRINWPDQDIINLTFRDRILPLEPKWNTLDQKYSPSRNDVAIWHFQGFVQKPWCNIWKNITWRPYLKYLRKSPYRENARRFVWGHIKGFFFFKYTKKQVTRVLVCGALVWKKRVR